MGKVKFTCEFVVRSSPGILYSFLTSSSSLAQWFSDTCDINGKIYTFGWDGAEEEAERLDFIEDQYVKYRWTDSEEDEFFDFEISKSEISNDTILTINDFAEEDEIEDQSLLWESQIKSLSAVIGAG
ncbi:MAG: START-like domain-containing protein [Chitinophagales bacterium]